MSLAAGIRRIAQLLALLAGALTVCDASADRVTPAARDAFIEHWPSAIDGQWTPDRRTEKLLRDYPLWPDLRAAWYSARLDETPRRELLKFMQQHAALAPIRRLRYRYISRLASRGDWRGFFDQYQSHYQDTHIAALDCHALTAAVEVDDRLMDSDEVTALARRLWLVGASQHDNCDKAFATLLENGTLSKDDVAARMALAIEARNFSLAAYLAGRLDDRQLTTARRWQTVHGRPSVILDAGISATLSDEQVDYALRRLALREPLQAVARWRELRDGLGISAEEHGELQRHIAIATAQDHHVEALQLLRELPVANTDQRVLEWRARTAMRHGDWPDVVRAIGLMTPQAAASDRWRYWEASALQRTGQADAGRGLMRALARERSFYGFLAADRIGEAYRFASAALGADKELVDRLADEPALIRSRELYAVGQIARADHEWRRALRNRSGEELKAAAALAHRWGWHAEAIALLGRIEAYDDLDIRYPLAYREQISRHASQTNLSPTWVYGITRSESLFDKEVRSSAGAWGLMQLMPATGRRVASRIGVRWRGIETLKDAETNIALGTHYLAALYERFAHPALATAAYNAGPQRVDKWLPGPEPMDADVWIETIAYDETRSYVQRVLAADVIFRWRLGMPTGRLSDALAPVSAKQTAATLASRL